MFTVRVILLDKMTNAKRILITTERRELLIVHSRVPGVSQRVCHLCPTEQKMLTLDEATELTGISTLDLIQQLDSPTVHSYETAAGRLLICQESLKTLSNGVNK